MLLLGEPYVMWKLVVDDENPPEVLRAPALRPLQGEDDGQGARGEKESHLLRDLGMGRARSTYLGDLGEVGPRRIRE